MSGQSTNDGRGIAISLVNLIFKTVFFTIMPIEATASVFECVSKMLDFKFAEFFKEKFHIRTTCPLRSPAEDVLLITQHEAQHWIAGSASSHGVIPWAPDEEVSNKAGISEQSRGTCVLENI